MWPKCTNKYKRISGLNTYPKFNRIFHYFNMNLIDSLKRLSSNTDFFNYVTVLY